MSHDPSSGPDHRGDVGGDSDDIIDRGERFAIVGAGFCGVGVAAAFRRRGIDFDVLEANDAVGGNWYGGVYDGVHIVSSRKTTEFPGFPMPAEWPDFPSGAQMLAYLRSYADHCQLGPHMELRTRVEYAEPVAPGHPDERWVLRVRTPAGVERRRYRGLVVAIGHHWDRRFPDYPGEFAGEIIHAKDYRSPDVLRGRRVLVIGGGNSGCDIAVEAAQAADRAHISLRRGYWFMPKTFFGRPVVELMSPWMPLWMQRRMVKAIAAVRFGDYRRYGLELPDHEPFEHHPTINSLLLDALRDGRVAPHPDVARYAGDTIEFVDGQRAAIDLVVCATGYHQTVPLLPPGTVPIVDNVPQLVSDLVRPELRNLYVFGVSQARYGAGPLIGEGARTLAALVEVQRQLRHPVGRLLVKLGKKYPTSDLRGPFQLMRDARMGRYFAPLFPTLERWLG